MRRFLAALIVLMGVASCEGCQHNPAPTPVNPTVGDAAATPWDSSTPATCLDVCRHEATLNCASAAPTPAGASCVDVCANYQKVSPVPWDLNCRASAGGQIPSAAACAAIDRCP